MEDALKLNDLVPVDERGLPGIVVFEPAKSPQRPRISAFIWGGKTRPVPTLPFGRWKSSN